MVEQRWQVQMQQSRTPK